MTRKVSKILLYLGASVVTLLVAAALFSQTGAFKETLRSTLYTLLQKNLNARVYLGQIHGNLVTGFSMDTLIMYVDDHPFVESGKIAVRYDPLAAWNKRISLGGVSLNHLSVTLIRYPDGSWNVDHLAKSKSAPDTTPSPWIVSVKSLKINDARFRMIDSTAEGNRGMPDSIARRTVDFSDLSVQHIAIDLKGVLSEREQDVTINNVSFESPDNGLKLNHLAAHIHHFQQGAEVINLVIVTPQSHVEVSAAMKSVDVFKIPDLAALRTVPVSLKITSSTVAAEDIQRFLPSLNFLRGSVNFNANIDGEFGNLQIKELDATTHRSTIILSGTLSNLHRPADLTMNIESKGSVLQPQDVPDLLPFFHIPAFPDLGEVKLDFHYIGKPLDFQATVQANTAAGILAADASMNLTGAVMKYEATAGGHSIDLARFFPDASLSSQMNFAASIRGEGTSIEDLNSTASLQVDSSFIHSIGVHHAAVTISAAKKIIQTEAAFTSTHGSASFNGTMDFHAADGTHYIFNGGLTHFDLSPFLKEEQFSSDCSLKFGIQGKNLSLEETNADAWLQFDRSRFETHMFEGGLATIRIAQDSLHQKLIEVHSPVADISINGLFSYKNIADIIAAQEHGFSKTFLVQRAIFDSTAAAHLPIDTLQKNLTAVRYKSAQPVQRVHYSLQVKDIEPVAFLFGENGCALAGSAEGVLEGTTDTLFTEGTVSIRSGRYPLSQGFVLVENGSVEFRLSNLRPDSLLSLRNGPSVAVKVTAGTIFINETQFKKASVDYVYHNRIGRYSISGSLDTTFGVGVDGRIEVQPLAYHLRFDHCSLRYRGYELNNTTPVTAVIAPNSIQLDSVVFIHQDEQLSVGGELGFNGAMSGFMNLQNFSPSDMYYGSSSQNFQSNALAFGGTLQAECSISGTTREPVIRAHMVAGDVTYRESYFGTIDAGVFYHDKQAAVQVALYREQQSGSQSQLLFTGMMPVDLSFVAVDHRFDLPGLNLSFAANDFQLSILSPFLPGVDDVSGKMTGTIFCNGSLAAPIFGGSTELHDGAFRMISNNIVYKTNGIIQFHDSTISFSQFTIGNTNNDWPKGKVTLDGSVMLHGFVPSVYHLLAKGELMVLQKASRTATQSLYGDLVAATGDDGIRFEGNYAQSNVTGTIYVKQAQLVFPPTRQSLSAASSRFVKVTVIDDTSKRRVDTLLQQSLRAFARQRDAERHSAEPSFLDGLGYDLTIQTQGVVQITMIFNAATNEELFADLNGKLNLSKEGNNVRLTGTINVSDRSNYKFYKQFDASGTLTFTGPPDNPKLDINAQYTGTHLVNDTTTEKVVVSLTISGTRYEPKVKIGLSTIDNNNIETERTGDVEADAIAFLLTSSAGTPGKFRDDLTSNDKQGIANNLGVGGAIGYSVVSGFANTMLSGVLMDFMRSNNISFVSSAEVRSVGAATDLRLSGEVADAYWSFGGKVFNDINNANVSVQLPLSSVTGDQNLRNLMLEVNRKVESVEPSDPRRPTSGIRLYYRIIF
jgi:hypothetical protein